MDTLADGIELIDALSEDPIAPPEDEQAQYECIIEHGLLGNDLRSVHPYRIRDYQVGVYAGIPGAPHALKVILCTFGEIYAAVSDQSNTVYVRWEKGRPFYRVSVRGHSR